MKIPALFNTLLSKAKSLVMEELNTEMTNGQSMPESSPGEPSDVTRNDADTQPSPVKKITWVKGVSAVFNGIGIGLLLGILLGLSISPVVSGVIATLSGLLAVLLGLDEKYLDTLKSLRIGAFGISAVAGIILGLYIRAHDPLSPSLLDKKNEYVKLGFSEAEARSFIVKKVMADTVKNAKDENVLYSSTIDIGACDVLSVAQENQPSGEIVNTFIMAAGTWKEFAETFQNDLPDELVGKSLLTMRDCFCNPTSTGKFEMTGLDEIRKLGKDDNVSRIEEVLESPKSGKNWQMIVEKVKENIPEAYRKDLYLSIIKVLSHD